MAIHVLALCLISILFTNIAQAESVSVTILHTNDLHSHFREEKTPLALGGVARLKTAVDRIRKETPNTLLVDGGDWSEGNIYYNGGAGIEALRMMDRIGYDVAVAGNHDWINGPDILLDTIEKAQPKTQFLAANLDPAGYKRADEFHKWILPYTIREIGGVKIAFIGLTTYEYVYDRFVSPVIINELTESTNALAAELKKQADAVVVISHNSIANNRAVLLAAPDVDLIVGAHDHVKLTKPVEVEREDGSTGWIVETGCWGRYLGRVDMKIGDGKVSLEGYKLIQMDASIPNDPSILADLDALDGKIQDRYGSIFQDHVGESSVEFHRSGVSSPMGNLVTDAYRNFTQADIAVDVINFIYGEIHRGPISSVDVFNSNPAVYNPDTQKSWTLKTVPISGRILKYFLNIMYSTKKLSNFSLVNVSGISFKFDPLFHLKENDTLKLSSTLTSPGKGTLFQIESFPMVQDIMVQGKPLDSNATYRMATGGGIVYAIDFINKNILNLISLDLVEDTGVENWRVLSDYVRSLSPISPDKLKDVDRVQTIQQDLGISEEDVTWEPIKRTENGMLANIRVRVKNYGATASSEDPSPSIQLMTNKNGINYAIDPDYDSLADSQIIQSLLPGQAREYTWQVTLPEYGGIYGVTAQIHGIESEVNHTNDEVTRLFR